MARQGGLGRGLGALIPTDGDGANRGVYRELALDRVTTNRNQPRAHFDEEALAGLTDSIREVGVLQPVLVRELDDSMFELIAGERRWRAAKRAGLTLIPAIVRTVDDMSSLAQAVVENIHREDLNPLEEGAAYQQLLEDFGLTHEELGSRLGKSRVTITNTLRLLQLPPTVQRLVAERAISAGHARALLGSPDRAFQEKLAARIVSDAISVRAVEDAVRASTEAERPAPSNGSPAPRLRAQSSATFLELESILAETLATNVRVQMTAKKGRVTIDFADLDDLERIFHLIQSSQSSG